MEINGSFDEMDFERMPCMIEVVRAETDLSNHDTQTVRMISYIYLL